MTAVVAISLVHADFVRAEVAQPPVPTVIDVPLAAWVASRRHALPETLPDFATSPARMALFRTFAEALAAHDWKQALSLTTPLAYELVALREANSWFVIASDASMTGRDPTIVINLSPRRDFVVHAPHVPFESGTAEQAVLLLRDLAGRAAMISGAHRCASKTFTRCDGRTEVCGTMQTYRDSDVGHNVDTLFHTAHIVFTERWGNSVAISLHGMKSDTKGVRTSLIVSNGIRAHDQKYQTAATRFRDALDNLVQRPGAVVSCNVAADAKHGFRPLCGYTNVQGRHINGDADACSESVDHGTGRFIHVEQDWDVLGPYEQAWRQIDRHQFHIDIVRALSAVLPAIR